MPAARRNTRTGQGTRSGQGTIEYAIVLSLVALVCLVILVLLGSSSQGIYTSIGCTLDGDIVANCEEYTGQDFCNLHNLVVQCYSGGGDFRISVASDACETESTIRVSTVGSYSVEPAAPLYFSDGTYTAVASSPGALYDEHCSSDGSAVRSSTSVRFIVDTPYIDPYPRTLSGPVTDGP